MKLREIGEFDFIYRISSNCIYNNKHVIKGIGDDCSVCRAEGGKVRLVTADLLVERVHFIRETITPFKLGHKSLAVNLSDIAAMGGTPKDVYISLAIPKDTDFEFLEQLYMGIKSLALRYNINVLGGDTTNSLSDLMINVTVIGEMLESEVLYRKGARIGDYLYLTGNIGNSAAGLDILLNCRDKKNRKASYLVNAHLMPYPYLNEAQWLAGQRKLTSMIDVSDGVASDLGHICQNSEVGAIVYEEKLPISQELKDHAQQYQLDLLKLALNTGEDYVLLFTVSAYFSEQLERLYYKQFGKKIYLVGEIVEKKGIQLLSKNQNRTFISKGWNHFD